MSQAVYTLETNRNGDISTNHTVYMLVVNGEKFPAFAKAKETAIINLTMQLTKDFPFLNECHQLALAAFLHCENYDIVWEDYESAEHFLKKKDYRTSVQACKYKNPAESYVPTKQEVELSERETRLQNEKMAYMEKHAIRNYQKTARVHCPNCTADIPVNYVADDCCPLCHTDLQSVTVKNRLKRYDERIENAINLRLKIEEKRKGKLKKSLDWLFVVDIPLD